MANEILMVGAPPDWITERYAQHFTVHSLASLEASPETAQRIRAAVAFDNVSADLIGSLPELRLIAVAGAGYERVDLRAARARGIAITNTPVPIIDPLHAVWSGGQSEVWFVGKQIALRFDPTQEKDGGVQ